MCFSDMKKLAILLVCLFSMQAVAKADNEKPIQVKDLPQTAQTFISKHFADQKVAFAKVENEIFEKTYEVVFSSGDKVEFDRAGEWLEVQCRNIGQVPSDIVPVEISRYVGETYPEAKIWSIERDRYDYEIKLSNGWEVKFDLKFNVIDLDR